MRPLVRFALWLCRKLDVNPIDGARVINGPDAIARGSRWEAFYREEGGLADMIQSLRMEAFEAASELDPSEVQKLQYWAMADRNIRRLDQRIRHVIVTGQQEKARIEHAEREDRARRLRSI